MWVVLVVLGLASLVWLSFRVLVVQGRSIAGYSFIGSSFERTFSDADRLTHLRLTYADPHTLSVRKGEAVLSLEHVTARAYAAEPGSAVVTLINGGQAQATTWSIPEVFRVFDTPSEMFESVTYKGVRQEAGRPRAYYTGRISNKKFRQLLLSLNTERVKIADVEFSSQAVRDTLESWADQDISLDMDFSIDMLSGKVTSLSLSTIAPSIASLGSQVLQKSVQLTGQGEQAVTQLNRIREALDAFKAVHGGYPEAVSGLPQGLIPAHLAEWPKPLVSPACSEYYHEFTYSSQGAVVNRRNPRVYPEFSITFCLPENSGDYKAGIGILTPSGILTSTSCPSGVSGCFTKPTEIIDDTTGGGGSPFSAILELTYPAKE